MPSFRRLSGVTAALIIAGAIVGAICGLLALVPIPLLHAIRPTPDDNLISASKLMPWAAGAGALLGAVLGPVLAWSFLRPVPLWRLLVVPALGTIIGSFVGWAAARNPWLPGVRAVLIGGVAGMLVAGLLLSLRSRRRPEATS